ncbi:MAG: hypothetical protein ACTHN0_08235 [Aquihabitans sp.]
MIEHDEAPDHPPIDDHPFSLDSARQAAERDDLAAWVAEFLASPGSDNAPLAEILADRPDNWTGPVSLPLDQLNRLAGPPGAPVLETVSEEEWRDDVEELKERVEEGWEPPPLIVTCKDGDYLVEDGNHRIEGLRRAGVTEAWSIVNFEDAAERDRFEAEQT